MEHGPLTSTPPDPRASVWDESGESALNTRGVDSRSTPRLRVGCATLLFRYWALQKGAPRCAVGDGAPRETSQVQPPHHDRGRLRDDPGHSPRPSSTTRVTAPPHMVFGAGPALTPIPVVDRRQGCDGSSYGQAPLSRLTFRPINRAIENGSPWHARAGPHARQTWVGARLGLRVRAAPWGRCIELGTGLTSPGEAK